MATTTTTTKIEIIEQPLGNNRKNNQNNNQNNNRIKKQRGSSVSNTSSNLTNVSSSTLSGANSTTTSNSSSTSTSSHKTKPSYKHVPHSQKPPHLVAKRNARERRRVQAVNQAFYRLRKCVPIENRNKRVSKVKTLQRAIDYIRKLERILAEDDSTAATALPESSTQSAQIVMTANQRNSESFNVSTTEVDTTTATCAGAPEGPSTARNSHLPTPADSTSAVSSNNQYAYGGPFDDDQAARLTAKRQWHTPQVSSAAAAANYCQQPPTLIGSPASTNSSSGSATTRAAIYGQQQLTADHLPTPGADGECCLAPYGPPPSDLQVSRGQVTATGRYGKPPQNQPLPLPLHEQTLHQHHLHRRPQQQPEQEHNSHSHAYGHWWPQHSPQVHATPQTNQWPPPPPPPHHNGQLSEATGHLNHNHNQHQYLSDHQSLGPDPHQLPSASLHVSCPEPSHLATDVNISSAYPNNQMHHHDQPTNTYRAAAFSSPNQYHLSCTNSSGSGSSSSNGSGGSPYSTTNNHFRLPVVAANHAAPAATAPLPTAPTKATTTIEPTSMTLCDL